MRVLFLSTPLVSHTYPMVPLAWALRAAGHEVLMGTSGTGLDVTSAGLDVIDFDPLGECPSVYQLNAQRPDIVWHRATKVADGEALLIEATRQYTAHMVAVAQLWRPDLVVHSQLQGSGPVAAAKVGVPSVEHGSSLLRNDDFYERLPDLMPETFAALSVPGLPAQRVTLDVAPPSMALPNGDAWLMRYVPFNGGGLLPQEFARPTPRRRIAVTVGTNILAPNMATLLARTVAAAPDVDADLLLLLARVPDVDLGARLPANVRVTREWLPLRALLNSCAAIIHHGGAGSILAALDAGIPQLAVPSSAPNYLQTDAVRNRGVGIVADAEEVDAALINRLLGDEKLRQTVAEVRDEMAGLPSPVDLVPRLVALAG